MSESPQEPDSASLGEEPSDRSEATHDHRAEASLKRPERDDGYGHGHDGPSVEGPPRTGDPAVDAALAGAAAVQNAEPSEQLDTYVGTHRALQDRLADSGA